MPPPSALTARASLALHLLATIQALLLMGIPVLALLRPRPVARFLRAFPRNRWAGWLLTAAATIASALIVANASLGRFDVLKPAIPVLAILLFVASAWALRELLPVRALGACLLLVADPILDAILWAPQPILRPVATGLVYAMLLLAALSFLYPWLYTATLRQLTLRPRLRRTLLQLLILLGGALFLLIPATP